jgi:glycine betaine transporter
MVFLVSVIIVVAITLLGIANPTGFADTAGRLLDLTTEKFGWFYMMATLGFLVFTLYLAFSHYGHIRLGRDDEEPEFGDASWFAMLFSAGMGIGLVFFGVAEPMSHYIEPPLGAAPESPEAARLAMRYTFFHWGLHAWGIYAVVALAIAYFSFRRGYAGLISNIFRPLLGDRRVDGPVGKAIDVLAILATIFGVATALGFGALQINSGLAHLTGIPVGYTSQVVIIVIVTVLYVASAATGLDRGIRILSNVNLSLAIVLLLFTLFVGPTAFLFDVFSTALGSYLQNLMQMSLRLRPFSDPEWIRNWTLFYWAWWISWAPFVGMFIARVSRGRTIREFVLGVLLVPSLFCFIWFAVFGGVGLHLQIFEGKDIASAVQSDIAVAIFTTLEQLPFGTVLAGIATLLVTTFFITSADSATVVLGMLSSRGRLDPTARVKLVWGVLQSGLAIVLLLSGGLEGLRAATILAAAPFSLIMVAMCVALLAALKGEDRRARILKRREALRQQRLWKMIREKAGGDSPTAEEWHGDG